MIRASRPTGAWATPLASKMPSFGFSLKLFFSYFLFALALVTILTFVHIQFSSEQQNERFQLQAKELLVGKIALLKEYVSEGSPLSRLPWLMEHLHSSEGFDAWCIDQDERYLTASDGGWMWSKPDSEQQLLIKQALHLSDQIDPQKGFILDSETKMLLFPLEALISPSGTPLMVYIPKEALHENSMTDNLNMTAIMILVMVLLAIPFAWVISRPLNRAHADLNERSQNLQRQIDHAAQELTRKDRMLSHQSKLAAIGEMIGNISHQWRLPITRIQLVLQNLQLLDRQNKLDSELIQNSVGQAKEQIHFMSDTIDVFQDFYRTSGPSDQFFCLDECLENVIMIIGPTLQQKGIALDVGPIPHFEISGSKQQLGQVLLNLISNAQYELVQRKVEQPSIVIEAARNEKGFVLSVSDNAGGIQEEHLSSLFEPYFSTKKEQGTGLGLHMSRVIIEEAFSGAIEVRNSAVGAIFLIKIPSLEDPSADSVALADS